MLLSTSDGGVPVEDLERAASSDDTVQTPLIRISKLWGEEGWEGARRFLDSF